MKYSNIKFHLLAVIILAGLLTMNPDGSYAQRMGGHGGGGGGRMSSGSRSGSNAGTRPSTQPARPSTSSRPSTQPSKPSTSSRPTTQPSNPSVGNNKGSINGGSIKTNDRQSPGQGNGMNNTPSRGNATVGGNNNRGDVNINVDNSKTYNRNTNVNVRHNSYHGAYPRPPYYHGGYHYNCYHPYYYHPYHPYYWGPAYHPWGFFITALAVSAIVVSVNSQPYYYDNGIYYVQSNGGYTVVAAPVGATVTTIPSNAQTVVVNETTNNYYYGGTYYEKTEKGYSVVPPTAGTLVENLPEGGEEVKIGEVTYVKVGEVYYQPIQKDGKNMYEVVDVEEAKPTEEDQNKK